MKICEQKIKQFDQKEKLKYKGMFEKFAAEDSKKVLFEEKMKWLLLSCTDVHVLFKKSICTICKVKDHIIAFFPPANPFIPLSFIGV